VDDNNNDDGHHHCDDDDGYNDMQTQIKRALAAATITHTGTSNDSLCYHHIISFACMYSWCNLLSQTTGGSGSGVLSVGESVINIDGLLLKSAVELASLLRYGTYVCVRMCMCDIHVYQLHMC
jgi:hypothetical protein